MLEIKRTKKTKFLCLAGTLILMVVISFSIISCVDDNVVQESNNNGDKNDRVSFNVLDVQKDAITRSNSDGFTTEISLDLTSQKLPAQSSAGFDVCLIENTVNGVNLIKTESSTRANVKAVIDADFSTSGYRGVNIDFTTNTGYGKWFYNETTRSNGELIKNILWDYKEPNARFFSVYPKIENGNNKMTLSEETYNGVPYINFEVEKDVKKQVDLMTACSGDVGYVRGTLPQVNLAFHHALTAVKFAIGRNLSWGKTIDRVELRNVQYKGKYTLPTKTDGKDADWIERDDARTTVFLSDLNVSTSGEPNTVIMGDNDDNYTFYMLPQELTGKGVTAYFHCTDGTTITAPLTGSWKAGTTKTYKLSQNTSNWNYIFTVENPSSIAYNATTSGDYKITSYREVNGKKQAVKWKIVGYDEDGDDNYSMSEKPSWLTNLTVESGNGGETAEAGNANVRIDISNKVSDLNEAMQKAKKMGSLSHYYNLSNQTNGGNKIENTANSYIISASGYYQIPLVYGNAIKNGIVNDSAYISHAPTGTLNEQYILRNFKDHAGKDIKSPYINVQNNDNPAKTASVVWSDEAFLVNNLSIVGSGNNSFLRFRIPETSIKNGNAVIAIKNASGTIMWSWHLWFTSEGVLNTIPVTNYQNVIYKFTTGNLGMKYTTWRGTTYLHPRKVRVKIEQELSNGGLKQEAIFTITQDAYSSGNGYSTLYQFGRKDAFPGTNTIYPTNAITQNGGNNMSIQNSIQNPGRFYIWGTSWYSVGGYSYYNLWSVDNYETGYNDKTVIKTIYDPSPVGFHLPASNAFTGFTVNGQNGGTINTNSSWDNGYIFNNKISDYDNIIFFPTSGYRSNSNGSLYSSDRYGYYWSAIPNNISNGCSLNLYESNVSPQYVGNRSHGYSIRPVAE